MAFDPTDPSTRDHLVTLLGNDRDRIADLYADSCDGTSGALATDAESRTRNALDAREHLNHLTEALHIGREGVFINYAEWAGAIRVARGQPTASLAAAFQRLSALIAERVSKEDAAVVARVVTLGVARLAGDAAVPPSYLDANAPLATLAAEFLRLLLLGDRRGASTLILDAVREGTRVEDVYLHIFQRTQREVGRLWQLNMVTVAQEHFCSAATQLVMSQLYEHIFSARRVSRTLVAASTGGNLHEIGVRMVSDFFELAGWDTFFIGASSPTSTLLETVEERVPDVVAISATMSYHVEEVRRLIGGLCEARPSRMPFILVGGRPFTAEPELWRTIGADAMASDAAEAVRVANLMMDGAA